MSTYFPDSRNLCINGGNFSHVGRDQHIHHYNQINQILQQKEKEHTVFDDVSCFVELVGKHRAYIPLSSEMSSVATSPGCGISVPLDIARDGGIAHVIGQDQVDAGDVNIWKPIGRFVWSRWMEAPVRCIQQYRTVVQMHAR
ncbi:hypothetical protein PQX77_021295 [Marasmius sp. AFHP31]|nr:hypothetical protein PQX77_021295 [Marasmius sp. AFHP31]